MSGANTPIRPHQANSRPGGQERVYGRAVSAVPRESRPDLRQTRAKQPELAEALRRCLELPERERLELHRQLTEYLLAPADDRRPSQLDLTLERRRKALEDLNRAARVLCKRGQLSKGAAPTAAQYRDLSRELGLISITAVTRAFGLWHYARQALSGTELPESQARRRIRQLTAKRRSSHLDAISSVRQWLNTDPAPTTQAAFSAFVAKQNELLAPGQPTLLAHAGVASALCLPWAEVLSVARAEKTLSEARQQAIEALDEESRPLGLISATQVGLVLGKAHSHIPYLAKHGLPKHRAQVAGQKGWSLQEIEAWRDGKPFPGSGDQSQLNLIGSKELAERVGLTVESLRTAVHQQRWSSVPRPAGRIGKSRFWLDDDVESFVAAGPGSS